MSQCKLWVTVGSCLLLLLCSGTAVGSENVSLYTTDDSFESGTAIDAAIESGELESASTLVSGETLLVEIPSQRLTEDLDEREGSATDRFFEVLDDDFSMRLVHRDPLPGSPVRTARPVHPDTIEGEPFAGQFPATVYRSGTTTYVALDIRRGVFSLDSDTAPQFVAVVGYGLPGSSIPDGYDGPTVTWYPDSAIFEESVAAIFAPERIEVRVRQPPSSGGETLVRLRREGVQFDIVPVTASGTAVLDLRSYRSGDTITLELLRSGRVTDRKEGTVREPTATISDVSVQQRDARVELTVTATLSHGGRLQVENANGAIVGRFPADTDETLSANSTHTVTVPLEAELTDELSLRALRSEETLGEIHYETTRTVEIGDQGLPERSAEPVEAPADDDGAGFLVLTAVIAILPLAGLSRVRQLFNS